MTRFHNPYEVSIRWRFAPIISQFYTFSRHLDHNSPQAGLVYGNCNRFATNEKIRSVIRLFRRRNQHVPCPQHRWRVFRRNETKVVHKQWNVRVMMCCLDREVGRIESALHSSSLDDTYCYNMFYTYCFDPGDTDDTEGRTYKCRIDDSC